MTFSGITPGGFKGNNGRLLAIKFKPEEKGAVILGFNKEKTKIYLHTADGVEDSLILEKIQLPIIKGKENIPVVISDNEPSEWFAPEISQDPNIFDGKYFLVFAAQDKGSGIAYYAIRETRREKKRKTDAKWIEAESPYLLKDQKLKSFIYVKAIDKSGNERIAAVEPRYPINWYELWWIWIIIITSAVIVYLIGKKLCQVMKIR